MDNLKRYRFFPLLFCLTILGSVLPSSAQEETPAEQLVSSMGQYCNRTTEVSYRSQRVVSSDETTHVYVEGTLRKLVNPDSLRRNLDTEGYCYGDTSETPTTKVIIQGQDEFEVLDEPFDRGYLVLEVRALSPDNRYLATESRVVWSGLSETLSASFIDLEARDSVRTPDLCTREPSGSFNASYYEGFLSSTTAVVRCSGFNPRAEEERTEWYEALDLTTGTSQVLDRRPDNLQSYSTVTSELEITNIQKF